MHRFIKILLVLLVLFIVAAVAAPFVVPTDKIKEQVLVQIEAKTGRKVTVDHVSFSIFPTLGLDLKGATFGNPNWAPGNMAEIKTLKVGLALVPLLHGEYHLQELILEQPVIVLIKQQDRVNWQLSKTTASAPTPSAPKEAVTSSNTGNTTLPDLRLDKIIIKDGTVTYKDGNKIQTIPGINLTLKAPDLSEKADIAFSALYGGKKLDVVLALDKPLAIATGDEASATLKVSYGALDFTWQGTVSMPRGGVPKITGKIDVPSLDTTQLSQEKGESRAAAEKPSATPSATGSSHWSDAPITLDGLRGADADLTVSIGKLRLQKTTLENIAFSLRLINGNLQIQTQVIKAYGGTISMSAAANAAGAMNFALTAANAEAEPLLHDFAGYDKLSGTINLQTKLATTGNSERALVSALSGTGNMALKDGKLKGVNLAGLVRNMVGAGSDDSTTAFSELSASYTIAKGIVTTNDIKLNSSELNMSGAGTVDLPGWEDHLLLKPMLVTSQGSAGKGASGITVPVKVEGPLDHPHYLPDLASALKDNLGDPSKLKENAKDLKKSILNNGGGLQNLLR